MLYRTSGAQPLARVPCPRRTLFVPFFWALALFCAHSAAARAQGAYERELDVPEGAEISVRNTQGRVQVIASEEQQKKVSIRATSPGRPVSERDVRATAAGGGIEIAVEREEPRRPGGFSGSLTNKSAAERERIDLMVRVPARVRVKVQTEAGAVDVVGNVATAQARTDTGTIRADVPLESLRYSFQWTASRPRFFSEVALSEVKERRGGRYEIEGRIGDKGAKPEQRVRLELTTARGVVLFGVSDESAVPTDLRPRALTDAARAIIRSGDTSLVEAIRKVVPRQVGDYAETLPPRESVPRLEAARRNPFEVRTPVSKSLARLNASVTDRLGRAIGGLGEKDFAVYEDGRQRAVKEVTPASAPFNLVLLLDVSGSVEERLDFIRKAALAFVNTVSPQDRLAIISFRDDVQVVSEFTTDRGLLARRVKDIQAGGATSLYDSLTYALVHTLRPLRGERTGIIVLSDGDDNRSFIPFSEVLEATVETGALIYPLYVPSGLIPAAGAPQPVSTLDPMRTRYLGLTSRADQEGRKLAEVSGGVYYPITRLDQLQRAYDDVVTQLRASYSITYESDAGERRDARVRVQVAREGASVRLSPAVSVAASASQ